MASPEARLERTRRHVSRLRWYVIGLSAVLIFGAIVMPLTVIYYNKRATEDSTLIVACQVARGNISQLKALRELHHHLGIPVNFRIPVLPEECPDSI